MLTASSLQTVDARCPHCHGRMQFVRHITGLVCFLLFALSARRNGKAGAVSSLTAAEAFIA
jgi:hypothetical protein